MGTGFIFVCLPSEQWCPPPFLEQWGYNIIAHVLLNYQDSTCVLKSSPLPGLAADTHKSILSLNPEELSCSRWTQYSSAPCSPALPVPPSARTAPVCSHAALWFRVKMQCPLALLPLPPSVSAPSPGLGEAFSCISVLPEDAGFYPVPFCLPSALFLCPSATLSSAVVHLSRGVELLPTKRGGSAPSSSMLLSTTLVKPFGESVQENSFLLD